MDKERKIVMRLISFMWFKQNCKHLDEDYEFGVYCCDAGGDQKMKTRTFPGVGVMSYYPCCEKNCPVLSICKKEKK